MMMFTTAQERERYFATNGARAGDAMAHASSTNLGVWGNKQALESDCARILQHEIRCNLRTDDELPEVGEILETEAFQHAFRAARSEPTRHLGTALGIAGIAAGNQDLVDAAKYEIDVAEADEDEGVTSQPRALLLRVLREVRDARTSQGWRDRHGHPLRYRAAR